MKKAFILMICLCLSYALTAQETPKQKEIGLTLTSPSDFGFTLRTGTSKSMLRLNALMLSGTSNLENDGNVSTRVGLGMEYRIDVDAKLEFRYGGDVSFGYTYQKLYRELTGDIMKRHYYTPGINMVLGFNYKLNENFLLGIEFLPGISYKRITSYTIAEPTVKTTSDRLTYNLSTNSFLLSIIYRI